MTTRSLSPSIAYGCGAARLRQLLSEPGIVLAPAVYDPMTARISEQIGFQALFFGGWAQAAQLCTPEPFLSMTEVLEGVRLVTRSVSLPVIADIGGGYGEPAHVFRTLRECEFAGIAGVQLEDQAFPKRAHYHKWIEGVISESEMVDKITAACDARTGKGDNRIVIVGRTDASLTEGFDGAVKRLNRYKEAGCDMLLFFPNNLEEARLAPKEIDGPLVHVQGAGAWGRPILTREQMKEFGYKMAFAAVMVPMTQAKVMRETLNAYFQTGRQSESLEQDHDLRLWLESLLGLDPYYRIEEQTTERERRVMPGAAFQST